MSKIIINGLCCWVDGKDFIVHDQDELIHCRSSHPPTINDHVHLTGTLRSSIKSFNGLNYITYHVDADL